jgi:hypothetical protein
VRKPKAGQWWYRIPGFYAYGAYDSEDEAIAEGRKAATASGYGSFRVGKWRASVEAGPFERIVRTGGEGGGE